MRVDGPLITLELVSSDPVDQLEPRVNPAWYVRERDKQPPLGWRHFHLRTADIHDTPLLVDDEQAVTEAAWSGGDRRCAPSPKDRLDPQHQLARAEGFSHVIVRAQLKPGDPIGFGALGCQYQDRRRPDRS